MADYVFHVLHNARPEYLEDVFFLLENGRELCYEQLLEQGEVEGLNIGYDVTTERQLRDILQYPRVMGLVEPRENRLTDQGTSVANIVAQTPDLLPDIIHYLYYTLWDEQQEGENCFSWSYRRVCEMLWDQQTTEIDKKSLASAISAEAAQAFDLKTVSFSTNSINGILNWLEALSPPSITQEDGNVCFTRREFCSPELFILAVDHAYRERDYDYSTNLLLGDEQRNVICQMCLLESDSFERVLEYAVAQFKYLEKGIGGGWGNYLTLHRAPELADFIRTY